GSHDGELLMAAEIVLPEWLVVADEPCASRAFQHLDLSPLLGETDRGANEIAPYVHGSLPFPGWLEEIDATVTWLVNGRWDPEGVVHDDPQDGLFSNLEFYRSVFRDDPADDGTKAIELHLGDTVLSGSMQCRRWAP